MSFYGEAPPPDPKEELKFITIIRETVKKASPKTAMRKVNSFLHAVALYSVFAFGHIETLAMLAAVKKRIEETDRHTGKRGTVVSPF